MQPSVKKFKENGEMISRMTFKTYNLSWLRTEGLDNG